MVEPYILKSTAEPAVGIDSDATITDWNSGATSLFGYTSEQVLGKKCWKVLGGRDLFGNEYCSADCPMMKMARRRQAINRSELCFRDSASKNTHTCVSTLVLPGEDAKFTIIHLFTPSRSESVSLVEQPTDVLTGRETEVLNLLSVGQRTSDIASELTISEATARNHINNILHKLKVHTRLEAVCEARRLGLNGQDKNHDRPFALQP